MIKKIKGKVLNIEDEFIDIEIGPLTIEAFPSYRIMKDLKEGDDYNFYASLEINEWNTSFYVFKDEIEISVYKALKTVSKIGPKTAARITKTNDAENVAIMISSEDVKGLSKLPGIGKKTAERLISELKNKFDIVKLEKADNSISDSVDALEALGFDRAIIIKNIKALNLEDKSTEEIIKILLSKM
jgi:Holliday junction DNA helicase RuvA